LAIERSGDDQFFIYTGGTTGMPKGVMWTHHDLRETMLAGQRKLGPVPESVPEIVEAIKLAGAGPRILPACPLMHGTGLLTAMSTMIAGGCVITMEGANFDANELWQAVDAHKP